MRSLKSKQENLTNSNFSSVNMRKIFKYTFGGLDNKYYFRQMFFSLVMFSMFIAPLISSHFLDEFPAYKIEAIILDIINVILYPYSRFLYERIIGFLFDDNVLFIPVIVLLPVKLLTMFFCWGAAIIIAPISLVYLYFSNSRRPVYENTNE